MTEQDPLPQTKDKDPIHNCSFDVANAGINLSWHLLTHKGIK